MFPHSLLSPTLPDLSSYSYRDEWLIWLMLFPLQKCIQCKVHFRNLVETWNLGQPWDAQWSWGGHFVACPGIWHIVFPWQTFCFSSFIALQEGPVWSFLQILLLLKHSATGGVGPSGDKGMPEAHASRDIRNTNMYSRIKVRALRNRVGRWVLNEDRSSKAMNSQTSLPVVTLTQIVLLWSACRELSPPPVYCPCLRLLQDMCKALFKVGDWTIVHPQGTDCSWPRNSGPKSKKDWVSLCKKSLAAQSLESHSP